MRPINAVLKQCAVSALLFTCASAQRVPPGQTVPQRANDAMQVKKLKVNDVELAYVEEGRGDTVVFVHGALGDWRSWEDVRPLISARYHFVSLSRRYHYPNPSTDDGRNYSQSQHVKDLAAFIRTLNVGKVHLVGNSGGSRLAGHVALEYPELVRSVVLGEPDRLIAPLPDKGEAAAAQDSRAKLQAALEAGNFRQAAMLFYDGAVGEQGAFEKLPPERQQHRIDNARTLGLGAAVPATCEQLAALRIPVLVIRGENSGWREQPLLGCLPKTTELVVIPAAHHGWNEANRDASAKAILAFLDKH